MVRFLISLFVAVLTASSLHAGNTTFLETTKDSLRVVAEKMFPFDPAFRLSSRSSFIPLDTVLMHRNLSPFDSTYTVGNPTNVSALYHIAPGREVVVQYIVTNTTVPYPVYQVNVSADIRGKEHDELGQELWKIKKTMDKAHNKLIKKHNKREISDTQYSHAIDSFSTVYYLARRKLEDKFRCSSIGFIGAPELVGKMLGDTATVLKKREVFIREHLQRIAESQEQVAIADSVCTLEPGRKYVLPDDYLEVYEFKPVGSGTVSIVPKKEFGVGTVISILNKGGYGKNCEYGVLVEYPDGTIVGTGNLRGYVATSNFVLYPHEKEFNTRKDMAWTIAISAVKSELAHTVRETAKFPRFDGTLVDSLDNFNFVVDSHFDAQDAFGITKRTRLRVTIQYLGGDDSYFHNWELIDSNIWQE